MKRHIGDLDKLSNEETKLIDYFDLHPSNTWLQAATDLDWDELTTCQMAYKLRFERWLNAQVQPFGQTQFTVRTLVAPSPKAGSSVSYFQNST